MSNLLALSQVTVPVIGLRQNHVAVVLHAWRTAAFPEVVMVGTHIYPLGSSSLI